MNINGCLDLINKFGNDNVPVFSQLKNCISVVNKICSCQRQRKAIKSEECNNLYINIINSSANNLIEYFKTKTTDPEIIFYHNGSHEIKRIRLR